MTLDYTKASKTAEKEWKIKRKKNDVKTNLVKNSKQVNGRKKKKSLNIKETQI